MKQKLIDLLKEEFGYPVSLQGSYGKGKDEKEKKLPERFFTFWNYETEPIFYSNGVKRTIWVFRVFFYSTDPNLTMSVMKQACKLLRENNFFVGGDYDIESGVKGYTGREVEINYIEEDK